MQNRVKKAATIFVLSAFTITCMPPVTTVAASIGDLQQQQSDLNSEKKDLKKAINQKAAEKRL